MSGIMFAALRVRYIHSYSYVFLISHKIIQREYMTYNKRETT